MANAAGVRFCLATFKQTEWFNVFYFLKQMTVSLNVFSSIMVFFCQERQKMKCIPIPDRLSANLPFTVTVGLHHSLLGFWNYNRGIEGKGKESRECKLRKWMTRIKIGGDC